MTNILFAELKLQNKIAVVTGGSRGIGRAIVEEFCQEGATVYIADTNDKLGNNLANEIHLKNQKAIYVHCDVSSEFEVKNLFSQLNHVDIVVNNAAIAIYKNIEEFEVSEWNQILAVNLTSVYNTTKYCIPMMKNQQKGNILSIASVHSRTTSTMNSPYVASKGAIVAFTRAIALEVAPYNIRVNCISPGAIETPMLMENWGDIPASKHPLIPRIPLKRIGSPKEIAKAALFAVSEDSSYMTATELLIDGGLSAHFD